MNVFVNRIWLVVIAAIMFVGCKPGIPGRYLQPDEMADILYDYHLAEGVVNSSMPNDSIAMRTYQTSILEHHGVSRADFDSSMVYYTRHTDLLKDVYTKLADRFSRESEAMGGVSIGAGEFASSDTANVWRQSPSFVLSPYAATNRFTFEMKTDTAWHEGDRLILDFDAKFIYQDGMRDAGAVLAVVYDNDSTEYVSNSVMSSTHYTMQISNAGRLRIKAVRGFWMLSGDQSSSVASMATLKLLVVSNVRLIRMHTQPPAPPASTESVEGSADSLAKQRGDKIHDAGHSPKPLRKLEPLPENQLKLIPKSEQRLR